VPGSIGLGFGGGGCVSHKPFDHFEKMEIALKDVYPNLEEFCHDWNGYELREGRIGNITNPNAKWDWWQIGGRYEGRIYTAPAENTAQIKMLEARLQEVYKRMYDENDFPILDIPEEESKRNSNEAENLEEEIQVLAKACDQAEWSTVSNKDTLSAFAIVKDGTWHERGRMGWWATVSDEKATTAWREEFQSVLETIRPDQWITLVDCHI
jgi:hypothetical protein